MSDARAAMLARVVADIATTGLGDRSLRDIAASVGTSHRMLNYHFGSRAGLVAAVVEAVEADQRALLLELAADADDAPALILALWDRVSSPEVLPFVRLFFEVVAAAPPGRVELTTPWLMEGEGVTDLLGMPFDPVDVRLGIAVTRGLLVDVLMSGDRAPATESIQRFVELWERR